MRQKKQRILAVSGVKNSGKTTLITKLLPELKKRGLREDLTIFIGGGPIRDIFRKKIGADYYIEDPLELRDYIRDNFSKFKKNKKGKNINKFD